MAGPSRGMHSEELTPVVTVDLDSQRRLWVGHAPRRPSARLRLFCLPYAGGGSAVFRGWANHVPADIEICPILLPGREGRLREPAARRLAPLAETIAEVIAPLADRPLAVFGHSMGAWIAFEVTRQLERSGTSVEHLFVSARPAPHLPPRLPPIHHLPDNAFLDALQARYGGVPAAIRQEPELLQLLLPVVRADLELVETYRCQDSTPLACPITAFGGLDDSVVLAADLDRWRGHTTGRFGLQMFPGGHFFFQHHLASLLMTITSRLSAPVAARAS